MAKKIIVLVPFTEVRNGQSYKLGDEITDPYWLDPNSGKLAAYLGREMVKVEEVPDEAAPKAKTKSKKAGD